MPIAIFSSKSFQVNSSYVYTFDEFTTGSGLKTEKQDVAGQKPSTYIKGPDLDSMSFNIPLRFSMGVNIIDEYESWKAIKEAGIAYPFILGGKQFGANKWLLTNVSLNNCKLNNIGTIISGVLQLEFEEYVRPGSAQASKSGGKSNKSPAVSIDYEKIISDVDKSSSKRQNPNMNDAIARIGYSSANR